MCEEQGSPLCVPAPEDDEGDGHWRRYTGEGGGVAVWNWHGSDQGGVPEDDWPNTGTVYCCEYNAYQYHRHSML